MFGIFRLTHPSVVEFDGGADLAEGNVVVHDGSVGLEAGVNSTQRGFDPLREVGQAVHSAQNSQSRQRARHPVLEIRGLAENKVICLDLGIENRDHKMCLKNVYKKGFYF